MSHHIVTVCVVCVLCAAHIPCSAHTEFALMGQLTNSSKYLRSTKLLPSSSIIVKTQDVEQNKDPEWTHKSDPVSKHGAYMSSKNPAVPSKKNHIGVNSVANTENESYSKIRYQRPTDKSVVKGIDTTIITERSKLEDIEILERLGQVQSNENKGLDSFESSLPKSQKHSLRKKRSADIMDEQYFIQKMFDAYGDGTSITMEGFEKLLRKLGLLRLLTDTTAEDHNVFTSQPDKGLDNTKNVQNNGVSDYDNGRIRERCLSRKELLTSVAQDMPYNVATENSTILPRWLFERVCPVLVYQLAGESSSERNGCIRVPENYKPITINRYPGDDLKRNMVQVWVYSTISILIISLCGLLGVAVIPFMGKVYYNQLLQFLVALAVGTLCGDALIHLLPHAMMSHGSHSHDHEHNKNHEDSALIDHEEQHNLNMWKGLVAMIGLVLFFFTEKALTVVAEWRKLRQRRNKLPSRVRVMRETDGPNSNVVGEKLCKHKYSSYPYCYGEITTETQDNHHNQKHNNHERPPTVEEEKPLTLNSTSGSKIVSSTIDKKSDEDWRLDESVLNNTKKNPDGADLPLNESESYTVIIREHETKHHGHTHSHGHVHSAPESMSSVAWMVVMGDGLHNFTDGMAIGAAFSANIAGGFSTAIAVFCHELPHELGDFAVLLKAGMSAKQAVFYNLLSSVLCLLGMVFGVLLGSTPAASSWVFAAAAGMFIYIALVDMMPELSSSHSTERSSQWQCVLQGLGLACGLGIMLIIALYEHDLKNIFSD